MLLNIGKYGIADVCAGASALPVSCNGCAHCLDKFDTSLQEFSTKEPILRDILRGMTDLRPRVRHFSAQRRSFPSSDRNSKNRKC